MRLTTSEAIKAELRKRHAASGRSVLAVENATGINHRSALRILTEKPGHRFLEVDMISRILALDGLKLAVVEA